MTFSTFPSHFLKNDFQQYPKPFSEIFFGNPGLSGVTDKNCFRKWHGIVLKVIFECPREC